MSRVHSFPPIAGPDAELLILGSMPGKASLRAGQYYAHSRNSFWPIIEQLFGIPAVLPYEQRCAGLIQRRLAVWDVLKTCTRASSLDADIDPASIIPNDFRLFLDAHPRVRAIYFNGGMAEQSFHRHVLPDLPEPANRLPRLRLLSTSPANASFSFDEKLTSWSVLRA